jgi:hypothetical protein
MQYLKYLFFMPVLFHGALLAQTPAVREEPFLERGFWDDLMENPGEYSYALIAFVVLGYFLWRVQGLDRDD